MNAEETYDKLISLLEYIREKKKLSDFSFDYRYQYSYLSALVNRTPRSDNGKVRKGNPESNKEIIKCAERFIKKNNL